MRLTIEMRRPESLAERLSGAWVMQCISIADQFRILEEGEMKKTTTVKKKAMGVAAPEVETLTVGCTNDECVGMLTLRTEGDLISIVCGECGQIFGSVNTAVMHAVLDAQSAQAVDLYVTDDQAAMPRFVLRADEVGHLRALMAVLEVLPESATVDGQRVLREFEIWEEEHRETAAGS
jgi:hypothetical protein